MEWSGHSAPCDSPRRARSPRSSAFRDRRRACSCAAGTATRPRQPRFSPVRCPRTTPRLLGAVTRACQLIHSAIGAGTRICVHGDYDVDGICATVLTVICLRDLGADVGWHLPSRFEEGYGLSGETLDKLADEGYGLVLTVDCGITAVDEVADAQRLGLEIIVTDHHRPGEELARLPDRRHAALVVPVSRALRYRASSSSCSRCSRRAARPASRPRRARDDRRRRPARRREPRVRARRAEGARTHPATRPSRADARGGRRPCRRRRGSGRLPPRPADQCRRTAVSAGERRSSSCSCDDEATAGRLAEQLEELNRDRRLGRGAHRARGDRAGRLLAGSEAARARLRARRRELARGRDRHRRLAAGRTVSDGRS